MTPWFDIYKERMNSKYLEHVTSKYAPFIEALYGVKGRKFTEIGCGAGNITRILREMHANDHLDYHMIDSCPQMLGLAIENNSEDNCTFSCTDIINVKRVLAPTDLVHSHGLLEHFEDLGIHHIVRNMLKAAPTQIHYVPGARYIQPSRGDERLMEPKQWERILRGVARNVKVSTFNDGYDIMIRIDR